jgi:sulfide dehydrogenase [flavocytochrome c] flavoprotein subunit
MKPISRRRFLKVSGIGVAASGAAGGRLRITPRRRHRRRLGRATAAKYVRLTDPSIEVTLLEPSKEFISCPFSNLVLAGVESLKNLTMNYNGLRKHGVKIRHEAAAAIEPDKKRVRVGKDSLEYDRLIVRRASIFSGSWSKVWPRRKTPCFMPGRPGRKPSSSPSNCNRSPTAAWS